MVGIVHEPGSAVDLDQVFRYALPGGRTRQPDFHHGLLGIKMVKTSRSNHAEENLIREVKSLKRVQTSKLDPCGPGKHGCGIQLQKLGIDF